eukprot:CAMPEP_0172606432 /NCGR_PEP_ID=MMETSP1068-20121228/26628_1 /TAXON_ID=35684 /ORGANISM="Pseudopedinella elastica, Strain CCMP716" /LENGTH=68 /DNA_ID=CAMNT_0013409123 /DNA_START=10 /DNA_END=212 /DNA_ORIENTATION=-
MTYHKKALHAQVPSNLNEDHSILGKAPAGPGCTQSRLDTRIPCVEEEGAARTSRGRAASPPPGGQPWG